MTLYNSLIAIVLETMFACLLLSNKITLDTFLIISMINYYGIDLMNNSDK